MPVWGLVKRFDARKGYGFLVGEDGKGDILLHNEKVRAFGVPSVATGARVQVRVEPTARGRRAAEVLDIQPPEATAAAPPRGGPLEPARVRWFDENRGYGFVNVFDRPEEDAYLHASTLRAHGLGAVRMGEAIAVRVTAGTQGPMVCEVRDWFYPHRLQGRRRPSHRRIALAARDSGATLADAALRAATRAMLRTDALGPRRDRSRIVPAVRAALRDTELEALFGLGRHARPVEAIFARVLFDPR